MTIADTLPRAVWPIPAPPGAPGDHHAPLLFRSSVVAAAVALASGLALLAAAGPAAAQHTHFHPEGKPASRFTVELRDGVKKALPFEDKRDFEENQRGLIAVPPFKKIMADAGHVAWDMESYSFLLQGQDFDSINPSL